MKNIVLIFELYFLIGNYPAECSMLGAVHSFFKKIWNPQQYQELPTSLNADHDVNDSQYDPFVVFLYKLDGKNLMDINANPLLYNRYIQDETFADIVFACPKTITNEENRITIENNDQTKKKLTDEKNEPPINNISTAKQTLFVEMNYLSFVKRREKQANQSKIETSTKNAANDLDLEAGEGNSTSTTSIKKEQEERDSTALDDARKFKCRNPVRTYLFESKKRHPDDIYRVYLVGFEVFMEQYKNLVKADFGNSDDPRFRFYWSLTVIISHSDSRVVCVQHEVQYNNDMYSKEINESFDDHDLGKEILFPGIDIANFYELENQEEVFRELFENEIERKQYFDPKQNKTLAKAHLAALQGFITPAVRQSAKTYGNVAPMWDVIKNGAWRQLEGYINNLTRTFLNLTVVSGTYGTLKLGGSKIFLESKNKLLPVPLAFWKLVVYAAGTNDSRGIFIVTVNNPYEDVGNIICARDECEKYGWIFVRETDHTVGRTICCQFPELIMKEIPILYGMQPEGILDLNEVFLSKKYPWELKEVTGQITPVESDLVSEKPNPGGNSVDGELIESRGKKYGEKSENVGGDEFLLPEGKNSTDGPTE